MEQFNLEKWLQDKSRKIRTREGKDVEIIYTNSPVPHHPIIGFIDKSIYTWTIDGKLIYGKEEQDKNDLFFADIEPYNPYKAAVESIDKMVDKYAPVTSNLQDFYDNVKVKCKEAMEYDKMFPQEEFVTKKQYDEDLGKAYKNADIVQFNRGMTVVLSNPHRYFHVGDTIRLKNSNEEHTITSIFNGKYYGEGCSLDIIKAADDYELVNTFSKQDEEMLNEIIDELTPYGECPDYPSERDKEYYYKRNDMIDWLKEKFQK